MTETCARPACGGPARSRGYCEPHYRKLLSAGWFGRCDGTNALAHVTKLRELGWTWQAIGKAGGIAHSIPHGLWLGKHHRLTFDSERRIMSVPLVRFARRVSVPAVGTRRRVRALARMGWPCREVALRAGVLPATLNTIVHRVSISASIASRVARVYEEISHLQGPSSVCRGQAIARGFPAPASWDYADMDDPAARPHGVRRVA